MRNYHAATVRWTYLASALALLGTATACATGDDGESQTQSALATVTVFLRAEAFTKTMPDGTDVVMWGYAQDSAFGAHDGVLSSPGPVIELQADTTRLTVQLENNLDVPTSLVIDGLRQSLPVVRYPSGRVRSFTREAVPGNVSPVVYSYTALRPGTFLYKTGTAPQVQVQMGLLGAVRRPSAAGEAYPGRAFDQDLLLVYSEVDPALHDAVATGQYGPGLAMTSTVRYVPKYFLINGEAVMSGAYDVAPSLAGQRLLVRFVNGGLRTRAPMFLQTYALALAEDGFAYKYPGERYSVSLPASKTADVLFTVPASGAKLLYDRMF
ncbi:MAG: multicopper oxidase domain-containing protein [Deltaproteobacteria bacterium]|nr:multicopper oxidase domain-containing protein [Deltaproteobacteria bacterium]